MRIVPLHVRQLLFCLNGVAAFFFSEEGLKETVGWIGASLAYRRCIMRRNFESKLVKKHVVSNADLRKVEKLFRGWGEEWYDYGEPMREVAKKISLSKAEYWRRKTELMGSEVETRGLRLIRYFEGYEEVWTRLKRIKTDALRCQ